MSFEFLKPKFNHIKLYVFHIGIIGTITDKSSHYNALKEDTKIKLRSFLQIDKNVDITSDYIQQILINITKEIRWYPFDTHRNEIVGNA